MTGLGSRLAPRPARRLLRDAGPPGSWVAISYLAAAMIAAALWQPRGDHRGVAIAVLAIAILPSLIDRTGWRIRMGMSWLAAEQRRRMSHLPRTPAGAARWLASPAAADESPFHRASFLLMAGGTAEARALVEATPAIEPEDRARAARLIAAFDGLERGTVDPRAAEAAIAELPPELARYHRISLAWSTAWVDVINGRPWRRSFARACEGIRTGEVPARFVAWQVVQESLPAIVVALFLGFLAIAGVL